MTMQTRELRNYKGFVIEATPTMLGKRGPWGTYLVVRRDRPGGPNLRAFEDKETFETRISAVRHCFTFGQQIIDGEIDGSSVEDL